MRKRFAEQVKRKARWFSAGLNQFSSGVKYETVVPVYFGIMIHVEHLLHERIVLSEINYEHQKEIFNKYYGYSRSNCIICSQYFRGLCN